MAHENDKRPEINWEVAQVFQDEDTGIMARVQKLPLRRPRFSIEIGQARKDKGFSRYLNPTSAVENGTVTLRSFDRDALNTVLEKAEEYVEQEMQKAEDAYKNEVQVREQGDHRNRRNGRPKGRRRDEMER